MRLNAQRVALAAVVTLVCSSSDSLMASGSVTVLSADKKVYVGSGPKVLVSTSIVLNPGDGAYLYGVATAYSHRYNVIHLNVVRLSCSGPGVDRDYTQSTTNHQIDVTTAQSARLLLVAPSTVANGSVFTCDLTAEVGFGASYLTFLGGSSNTFLQVSSVKAGCGAVGRCARWGIEDDAWELRDDECGRIIGQKLYCWRHRDADGNPDLVCHLDADCAGHDAFYQNGVYVGPLDPNGTAEYVLHSRRFEVPANATSLTVYSELQLTTRPQDTSSCPVNRSGGSGTGVIGLRLLVQQMCSPSSSTVAYTTTYPAAGDLVLAIPESVHHRKAHLAVNGAAFVKSSSACPTVTGRSFIVKTLVKHLSGPPFKVEMGCDDADCDKTLLQSATRGYSNGFAFANY